MAMWLYQLSQTQWTPEKYRLDIWEGERWRWPVGKIIGSARPAVGDRVVFFFAKTNCPEPGFYGWGIVLQWEEGDSWLCFRPVAPSDHLKMHPWWDGSQGEAEKLATEVRVPVPNATLFPVPAELASKISGGITCWLSSAGHS